MAVYETIPLFELDEVLQMDDNPSILEYSLNKPRLEELKAAVDFFQEKMGYDKPYPSQKIHVEFSEEVEVQVDRRKKKKFRYMKVKFFYASGGRLCYTFHKSTGYIVGYFDYSKIIKMSIEREDSVEQKRMAKVHSLLNRVHPNAWPELKERPESLADYSLSELNIKSRFPSYVIEAIRDAFEDKRDYSYSKDGTQRDIRVSVKVGEDGYVRGWYSSEYPGCGNGQYFFLINPTTAAFSEYD